MFKNRVPASRRVTVLLACVVTLAAVAGACAPATGTGDPQALDPNLTDPALPSVPNGQFSMTPPQGTDRQDRLVVLFNGTGGTPASLTRVARRLAADGFHVIGLRYESALGTMQACDNAVVLIDIECHRRFRSEVVHGANVSPASGQPGYDHLLLQVSASTSVMNRLLSYVDYLSLNDQGAGWDRYQQRGTSGACTRPHPVYGPCDLRWNKVVTMGYSQGAGVALYLAKHLRLDHVAMLAGSFDAFGVLGSYVPAPWLSDGFATDTANVRVLLHPQDNHVGRQRLVAESAGLTEPEVDVTLVAPPYWNSRRLVTTAQPTCAFPDPLWAHSAPVGGGCTEAGLHDAAWSYLAGAR